MQQRHSILSALHGPETVDPASTLSYRNVIAFLDDSGAVVILLSPETCEEKLEQGFDFDPDETKQPWPYPEVIFSETCRVLALTGFPFSVTTYLKMLKAEIHKMKKSRLSFCIRVDGKTAKNPSPKPRTKEIFTAEMIQIV